MFLRELHAVSLMKFHFLQVWPRPGSGRLLSVRVATPPPREFDPMERISSLHTEVILGVPLIRGLISPGPAYQLPGMCFADAAKQKARPTWGPPPKHDSQKLSRARVDEMRFLSNDHMREMRGHFSPGPQYTIPTTIGGAQGNSFTNQKSLQKRNEKLLAGSHGQTADRGVLHPAPHGAEPIFKLTPGSYADQTRASRPATSPRARGLPPQAFWNKATTAQEHEFHSQLDKANAQADRKPWVETSRHNCYGHELQDGAAKNYYTDRNRSPSRKPLRQLADACADPPLANVFGSLNSKHFLGSIGGIDREWRESKVVPSSGGATAFGPPPKMGPLRAAYVQPMGPNSIPRSVPKTKVEHEGTSWLPGWRHTCKTLARLTSGTACVYCASILCTPLPLSPAGGRITMYAVERPMSAYSQSSFDGLSRVNSAEHFPPHPSPSRARGSPSPWRPSPGPGSNGSPGSRTSLGTGNLASPSRGPSRALGSPVGATDLHGYSDTGVPVRLLSRSPSSYQLTCTLRKPKANRPAPARVLLLGETLAANAADTGLLFG